MSMAWSKPNNALIFQTTRSRTSRCDWLNGVILMRSGVAIVNEAEASYSCLLKETKIWRHIRTTHASLPSIYTYLAVSCSP